MTRNTDQPDTGPTPTIRLRGKQFDAIAVLNGWDSDAAAGRAIGVDGATVWRVRRGLTTPGEKFIAGLLLAVQPQWHFDDLFTVCADASKTAS